MKTFTQEQKNIKLSQVEGHYLADEIVQGTYWKNGKGCAVGCILHSNEHSAFETELGVPTWVAYVVDKIHKMMSCEDAKNLPLDFINAIPANKEIDFDIIKRKFLVVVLKKSLTNFDNKKFPKVKKLIDRIVYLLESNGTVAQLREAGDAVYYAYAVDAAADADADADAAYADADADAAYAAAFSATFSAAAFSDAFSADYLDYSAYAAYAAYVYAAAYAKYFAYELIKLIQDANQQ